MRSIHAGNVDVPDFSYYRRSAVQSPSAKSGDSAADRMSYRLHIFRKQRSLINAEYAAMSWLVVLDWEVPMLPSPLSATL